MKKIAFLVGILMIMGFVSKVAEARTYEVFLGSDNQLISIQEEYTQYRKIQVDVPEKASREVNIRQALEDLVAEGKKEYVENNKAMVTNFFPYEFKSAKTYNLTYDPEAGEIIYEEVIPPQNDQPYRIFLYVFCATLLMLFGLGFSAGVRFRKNHVTVGRVKKTGKNLIRAGIFLIILISVASAAMNYGITGMNFVTSLGTFIGFLVLTSLGFTAAIKEAQKTHPSAPTEVFLWSVVIAFAFTAPLLWVSMHFELLILLKFFVLYFLLAAITGMINLFFFN